MFGQAEVATVASASSHARLLFPVSLGGTYNVCIHRNIGRDSAIQDTRLPGIVQALGFLCLHKVNDRKANEIKLNTSSDIHNQIMPQNPSIVEIYVA